MPNVPRVTGEEAIRAFGIIGFQLVRVKGSHHILKREGHPSLLTVPVHGKKTLGVGLLRSLIRAAETTVEDFERLLSASS
jgi:predicted RNA binding protein YcfA (HicA-like mRNA interferase family)